MGKHGMEAREASVRMDVRPARVSGSLTELGSMPRRVETAAPYESDAPSDPTSEASCIARGKQRSRTSSAGNVALLRPW